MASTRVLLTGGSGFVGLNLIKGLVQAGCEVVSLSRGGHRAAELRRLVGDRADRVRGESVDVCDIKALAETMEKAEPELVIHAAALTPLTVGDEREQFVQTVATNTLGTVSILEAARQAGVKRLLYTGSASVYGGRRNMRPLRETERPHLPAVYAISKYAGELFWLRYGAVFGMDLRIARISGPYGPWERVRASRALPSAICLWGAAVMEGRSVDEPLDLARDYTYIDDTVDGVFKVALAERTRHRVYNVASGRLHWFSEVLATLAKLEPGFQYRVGPRDQVPGGSNPPRGPLSIDRITAEFGFHPTVPLEEGLRRYLDWLRAGG